MMRRFVGFLLCLFSIFVVVKSQRGYFKNIDKEVYHKQAQWILENIPRLIYQKLQSHSSAFHVTHLLYKAWKSHWSYKVAKKLQTDCYDIANKTYFAAKELEVSAVSKTYQNSSICKALQRLRYFIRKKRLQLLVDVPKIPLPEFTRKSRGFTMVVPGGADLQHVEIFYRRNIPIDMEEVDREDQFGPDLHNGQFNASGDRFVFHDNCMRFFDDDVLHALLVYFFGEFPYYNVLEQIQKIYVTHSPLKNS